MSLYSALQSRAASLLAKFGQDVTLRKIAAGAYDTTTGTSVITPTNSTLKGALFDFPDGTKEANGVLVEAKDKYLLLSANGAAPGADDQMVIGGVLFNIIGIKQLNPAGTPLLYVVHLR